MKRIETSAITKIYNGISALDGLSLSIDDSSIYGIIGRSGAGKSTLLRILGLLESPDAGLYKLNDIDVSHLTENDLIRHRRSIGTVFQHFNLFASRTAFENIAYPLEITGKKKSFIRDRVETLLKLVGMSDRGDARLSQLSGGQKQRIAIARALAAEPDILLCDEATSALDPGTTREILQLLKDLQSKLKLTIVIITHHMEVISAICDRVAVLEAGRIVEEGPVPEIFTGPKSNEAKELLSKIQLSESAYQLQGG